MTAFTSWLRNLNRAGGPTGRVGAGRARRNRNPLKRRPLGVQCLEDRTMPSTTLVTDISPTDRHAYVGHLTTVGASIFFTGNNGTELWKTDGTAAGTVRVKEIGWDVRNLTVVNGALFFTASDAVHGNELWKSDGTAAGTVMVKDVYPDTWDYYGTPSPNNSNPGNLTAVNGTLFFTATGPAGAELWRSDGTEAGTVMVKDIAPGSTDYGQGSVQNSSFPSSLTAVNGTLYFAAADEHGFELWKTDGTENGTVLVRDIFPGDSSAPHNMVAVNGVLYFAATDERGQELWRSDGTAAGTVLVRDIYPGSTSYPWGTTVNDSAPASLAVVNGTLYFSADDGTHGRELWKSDGTAAGTVLVADLLLGSATYDWGTVGNGSAPQSLTAVGGVLYFTADDGLHGIELWNTDGTAAGTVMVKDINPGGWAGSSPDQLTVVNGVVFFAAADGVHGREVWRTDGTAAGTRLVQDLTPGSSPTIGDQRMGFSSTPQDLIAAGGALFFTAEDIIHGREVWRTDGTPTVPLPPSLVADINTVTASSSPANFVKVGGTVFFTADDGVHGTELWKTDGTDAGTALVKDIDLGGPSYYGSSPGQLTAVGGRLFFVATDAAHGQELWTSDGTEAGTVLVTDVVPGAGYSAPSSLTAVGGLLYFTAWDGSGTRGLWKSDGTTAGTTFVAPVDYDTHNLAALGGVLYFGRSGAYGGLWRSDGTAAGTMPVMLGIGVGALTAAGDTLFFPGAGPGGVELWASDGTAAGTRQVKDISPDWSTPTFLTAVGDVVYFSADEWVHGRELWRSDGTEAGTWMVADIATGAATDPWGNPVIHSSPEDLFNWNGTLYFSADDGVHGRELWKSDGTAAGTVLVRDIDSGTFSDAWGFVWPGGSRPTGFVALGGALAFAARDAATGYELWKTDGTAAGTVLVKDVHPGPGGGEQFSDQFTPNVLGLTALNGAALFAASDGRRGMELWRSDVTTAGTTLVRDINGAATFTSSPADLTAAGGVLFFTAHDGAHGRELWSATGTGGAALVRDITPGLAGDGPQRLTAANGVIYFTADDGLHGRELWTSDGTAAGTRMVKDLDPAVQTYDWGSVPQSSSPYALTVVGQTLYFVATDTVDGEVQYRLWASDGTEAGTVPVADVPQVAERPMAAAGSRLFFWAFDGTSGWEVWTSDGTTAGTRMVKDVGPGYLGGSGADLTTVAGVAYFSADDGAHGQELWRTDGTEAGTWMVRDIFPGPAWAEPQSLVAVNGVLYFSAGDGVHGRELWRSDGTEAGTWMVHDIAAAVAPPGFGSDPQHLVAVNGTLYFSADDGTYSGAHGRELWRSDGTGPGTVLVADIGAYATADEFYVNEVHGSVPSALSAVGATLYFAALTPGLGWELWRTDGTATGTEPVADLNPGRAPAYTGYVYFADSFPANVTAVNGTVYFTADDGAHGTELWRLATAAAVSSQDLQASLPPDGGTVSVRATSQQEAQQVVAAVNGLASPAHPVEVAVDLGGGTFAGVTASPPANVTLTFLNGTFNGASPAMTVTAGVVIIMNSTLQNATDAPTILVTGGHVTIRNSTVRETTGGTRAAIDVRGGAVNLGTAADPGGNTLVVRGPGELIRNVGVNSLSAIGNRYYRDEMEIASQYQVEDLIFHALDAGGGGLVTCVRGNVYVTPASRSIQRGVNMVPAGGTVNVAAGQYAPYTVGAKPLTVSFQDGPTLSLRPAALPGGGTELAVTGTPGRDAVTVTPRAGGSVGVSVNALPVGTFAPTERVVVHGLAGDDDLQAAGGVTRPAWLYGGDGNDRLKGGEGHNVLLGGDGDDLLVGGSTQDVQIGGAGADRIVGNAEDDILIAGWTAFDADEAALGAVLAEWTSGRSYAARVANLAGTGSGPDFDGRRNGTVFLRVTDQAATTTVFDDGAEDVMTGSAGQDWFFANLLGSGVRDRVTDLSAAEFATDLTFIQGP